MINTSDRVRSLLILLLAMVVMGGISQTWAARSEDTPILIDKVEIDTLTPAKQSPSRGSAGSSRDTKWYLIEFSFMASPDASQEKDKSEKTTHLEEVTFKVSVEGRAGEGDFRSAPVAILSGEVTYIAVPFGKNYGCLYISPDVASVYRIDRFASQLNVNVQALVGGQVVDSKDKRKDEENWFSRTDYKQVSGLLFNKNITPFIITDADRYPTIKPKP